MEFLRAFKLKEALITPWLLYLGSVLFETNCMWEKWRAERKQIALAMMFFATVFLGILA